METLIHILTSLMPLIYSVFGASFALWLNQMKEKRNAKENEYHDIKYMQMYLVDIYNISHYFQNECFKDYSIESNQTKFCKRMTKFDPIAIDHTKVTMLLEHDDHNLAYQIVLFKGKIDSINHVIQQKNQWLMRFTERRDGSGEVMIPETEYGDLRDMNGSIVHMLKDISSSVNTTMAELEKFGRTRHPGRPFINNLRDAEESAKIKIQR